MRLEDPEATLTDVQSVSWDEKPISRFVQPIFQSSWFILLGVIGIFSILAFTMKQWTDHERLTHPLCQIHVNVVDSGWKSPAFRLGFALMALVWIWQMMSSNVFGLPMLPLNSSDYLKVTDLHKAPFLGMDVPPSAKWVYTGFWNTIRIIPFVIAIAFLVATDVGFSVWAGFFFGALVCGWLYNAGIEVDFMKEGRMVSGGALVAFAFVILYLGRHHYWALLKAAFGRGSPAASDDHIGVWGVRCLLGASVGLGLLMFSYSGSIMGSIIGILLTWAVVMVVARIVAESGLVGIQAQPEINPMLAQLGLASYFPLTALIILSYIGSTLVVDSRENLGGFGVQANELGREGKVKSGRFLAILGALAFVAGVLGIVVSLLSYVAGPNSAQAQTNALSINQWVPAAFNPNEAKIALNEASFLSGALLVFLTIICRRFWAGFLFHPIGLIVAASWPIYNLWGSLMIGWVFKVLILRYGGAQVYSRLKPFAIGIVVADAGGFALENFLRYLSYIDHWTYQPVSHWPL